MCVRLLCALIALVYWAESLSPAEPHSNEPDNCFNSIHMSRKRKREEEGQGECVNVCHVMASGSKFRANGKVRGYFLSLLVLRECEPTIKKASPQKRQEICAEQNHKCIYTSHTLGGHTQNCATAPAKISNGKIKAFFAAPRAIRTTIFIVTLLNTYLLPLWPVYVAGVCGISRILLCCLHFTRNYIPLPSSQRV